MLKTRTRDPFRGAGADDDPLPHFAPFFLDDDLWEFWHNRCSRRAEADELFSEPNTGFHHNPLESDVSYLYVAASPNYPDEVKIGMTKNRPDTRLKDARYDKAFRKDPNIQIQAFFMIKNARAKEVERAAHKLLEGFRSAPVTTEKEWFRIRAEEALFTIELAARNHAKPDNLPFLSVFMSTWRDPEKVLMLQQLIPKFDRVTSVPVTDRPDFDPDRDAGRLFSDLSGVSFEHRIWDERTRDDVVFVPITEAPETYFWERAEWLLPQRAKLAGERVEGVYPINHRPPLYNVDVSDPRVKPLLDNGVVPGRVSRTGYVDLSYARHAPAELFSGRSVTTVYETDLVASPLMERISTLYWELRNGIEKALPPHEGRGSCGSVKPRDAYLHKLCSDLLALPADEVTPKAAMILHGAAMSAAGTPADLCLCPLEICEIALPALREHGRSPEEMPLRYGPEAA